MLLVLITAHVDKNASTMQSNLYSGSEYRMKAQTQFEILARHDTRSRHTLKYPRGIHLPIDMQI